MSDIRIIMSTEFFELLQLNDATFPIGSYTHSWGLETFVQQGIVHDAESAKEYFTSELEANFLCNDLLCVRLSYEAALKQDWSEVCSIDEIYNASKTALEIRDGSKKLAARFFKTVSTWNSSWNNSGNEKLQNAGDAGYIPHHFAVAYGVYCAVCKIDEEAALKAFLYSQISARVVTAVKLVPLSQTEGQKILHGLFTLFESSFDRLMGFSKNDLCRSCPSSEIKSMQHEFLYTRLYMS